MNSVRGVSLAAGESVIREYEATKFKMATLFRGMNSIKGYLIVTNRRLLFAGEAKAFKGNSLLFNDVQIEQVTGIHGFVGKGKSEAKIKNIIIITLIILAIGYFFPPVLIGLLYPAFVIYKLIRNPIEKGVINLVIMANGQGASSINISASQTRGSSISSLFSKPGYQGDFAWFASIAAPGKDAEVMMNELGALILDIQETGMHAVRTWNSDMGAANQQFPEEGATALACSACGAEYEENDRFCGICGENLENFKHIQSESLPEKYISDKEFFGS